jgi:hypothetical protein
MDDFGIANPLGPASKRNKIFAVYFTIGNFGYKTQCQRKDINLLILAKRQIVDNIGIERIMNPLVKELIEIEKIGINFNYKNNSSTIKCRVSAICGDNLGMHEFSGLTKCFRSGCICRYCYATYNQIQKFFSSKSFIKRNLELYNSNLKEINRDKSLRKKYGILKQHSFYDLKNFDITKSCVCDLMHDFCEGIIPKVLKLILTDVLNREDKVLEFNKFILENKFRNGRIKNLEYKKIAIKGKASQVGNHLNEMRISFK